MKHPKKVLILGSGALKIGQAGEFDYSGSQAIKAMKEEGIKTILINPNIATIQTSEQLADRVYFLPVTPDFVERVIAKERPDAVLLSFGGQTALNCGTTLHENGTLKKYKVKVLGTPVAAIELTEDRAKFARHLKKLQIPTPQSRAAHTVAAAISIASEIGYPVMIRAAYALGGQKSGIAQDSRMLGKMASDAFSFSPQILVEKYLHHYKEVEYEVVRDASDNCVTVCNMENMDPLGIHTGESIVVAPSQTLTNFEYHHLRRVAIEIVRSLGIVGECNVQYAVNPKSAGGKLEYYVIEINARLSRSSALASKATGYPLAYVAAKLALGYTLMEIPNQVTKVTQSFFEPALDYLAVKIPRWDLDKFRGVTTEIGSSMKSVGEVMAIGRTFEECLQKAVRMLEGGFEGVTDTEELFADASRFDRYIKRPTRRRIFALAEAYKRGMTTKKLSMITGIDPWFLSRIENIVAHEQQLLQENVLSAPTIQSLKELGFSDARIGKVVGKSAFHVRALRKSYGITPCVFQIDTMAAEFPARTNYLYMTYGGKHHDVASISKKGVMVIGSGPYRIGSSVEFDWTSVNAAIALKKYKKKSIIINCNPETVSTDYDISDRLYFEELSLERVLDIYEFEQAFGVIVSVGGQAPNSIATKLAGLGVKILGTAAASIDTAEDRNKFSRLLDTLLIKQPLWNTFGSAKQAHEFALSVGYPVLIRPSYVLSGAAMNVCYTKEELLSFVTRATAVNRDHPVTVSKFMEDAKEIEFDAVAQKGVLKAYAVCEHVEHAGVHSGDATIVYPPQRVYLQTEKRIIEIGRLIARALAITGPFNIQFLAKNNTVYVIEVNLRASRTFPFISKATGVNFARLLVDAFFGRAKELSIEYPHYVVVKAPQFSFSRLEGADPVLRVEMSSTGEAAAFGGSIEEAYLKAQLSVGEKIPTKGIFLSLGGIQNKVRFLDGALALSIFGLPLYATERTARFLEHNGIKARKLYKIHENRKPNILTYFQKGKVDLAINIVDPHFRKDLDDDYTMRRAAVDHNIHLITNRQKAALFIKSIVSLKPEDLEIKAWDEYL